MKFSCDQERLNAALSIAIRSVSTKNTNPALEGIFLEAGTSLQLTGYNLETGVVIEVPGTIEETGSLVIAARLISDIVRKLPKETIHFSTEQYWVTITCGASEFKIMGMDPSDYPELPEVVQQQGLVVAQSTLKAMINSSLFAITGKEGRVIHTGSLFDVAGEKLTMVALDGYRMAVRKETVDEVMGGNAFSFVVPGVSLSEVEKICGAEDSITIYNNPKHILFQTEGISLISRSLEGEFLDYLGAIPQNPPHIVGVSRRDLISIIDRVSLMISDKAKAPLRCCFGNNVLEMSSKTFIGEAKDICATEGDGNNMEMGFNHRFLQEALRHAPSGTEKIRIAFTSPNQPCLMLPEEEDDDRFCYMVLPVRLKTGE